MKRITSTFMLLLLAACAARDGTTIVSTVSAGSGGGAIRGTVTTGGGPLPGATVTLTASGAAAQTTVTDVNGNYAFVNLSPATYTLQYELSGLRTVTRQVAVMSTQLVRADADLRVSSVSEAITVTASAPAGFDDGDSPRARYAAIKEHDFIATSKDPTTTFAIDVDRASYANVRSYLAENQLPPPDAVRIEEMVNYFTYHYAPPSDGRPFAVSTEVVGCPWEPAHRLVRIGIQGRQIEQWRQAPNNLVFLLDVSGSMAPPNSLPLIRSALRLLVDQLRAEDSVAVVVYAGAAGVVLPPTSGAAKAKILAALDALEAGGSTAGGEGIELAYKLARENFNEHGNNRVILATDGDFNVGVSDTASLEKLIEQKRETGVFLTCIGVGGDGINDELMKALSVKGNGNYSYLDTIAEAKKVFVKELGGTLVTIAKDVKVQLEFDPSLVSSYRQIGYELRALENADSR